MVAYIGLYKMLFGPKGPELKTKVIKVTGITYRSAIFTMWTTFRVTCSYTVQAKYVYLGMATHICLYQMPFYSKGQKSNMKVIKVTDIICASTILTPGSLGK